ncbi:MAG: polysaccharide biosynthesis C-terminal domain-containing protein [Candidatus Lindowbacteria bacterium]|nr:polysaccharide biosynthesis C-terminal domain-containing protein [Candidatus Lindowbacteria bacterium]
MIADKLVPLIFGNGFQQSIAVMRILSWVLLFMFPSGVASLVVVVLKRQVYLFKALGVCIGLNIVLDFILIKSMGYYGACVATLIAEVLFATLLWLLFRRLFPSLRLLHGSINILLSAFVMGAVLVALKSLNLVVLILVGPVIYFPCLFLFRAFTRDEIRFFREKLLKRRAKDQTADVGI